MMNSIKLALTALRDSEDDVIESLNNVIEKRGQDSWQALGIRAQLEDHQEAIRQLAKIMGEDT
jgi:hypothetical protein